MAKLKKVRERSGAIVPFRPARLTASIQAAVRDTGTDDPVLSDELAGVVMLFLEKTYDDDNPPSVDEIRTLTAKVLGEIGHGRIAQSYLRLNNAATSPVPQTIEIVHHGGGLVESWNVVGIARGMLGDADLTHEDAAAIATAVESKLIGAGLARVDSGLIREFIDVELAVRGRWDALKKTRLVGVSSADVERWLTAEHSVLDPEEAAAEACLEEYMVSAVHSEKTARAHAEGRIHIFGLGHPQRVESVSVSAVGPAFPVGGDIDEFLLHCVTLIGALRPLIRRRCVFRDFSTALSQLKLPHGQKKLRAAIKKILDALLRLDVFGRPMLAHVVLEVDIPARADDAVADADKKLEIARSLLEELRSRAALGGRMGLVFRMEAQPPFHWPESETLDLLLDAARRHRGVAIHLRRGTDPAATPRDVLLETGAVGVNLPLAIVDAVDRGEDPMRAVATSIDFAVDGLAEKYWFLRRTAPQTLRGVLMHVLGGRELAMSNSGQSGQILLWGLPHAVEVMRRGKESDRDERHRILSRILSAVEYQLGEPRDDVPLKFFVGGVVERTARRRLLDATSRFTAQSGNAYAAATLATTPEDAPALPVSAPILSEANAAILCAPMMARMSLGLPLPARGSDELTNSAWLRRLFEATRLEYFEMEEKPDLFEIQENLFGVEE